MAESRRRKLGFFYSRLWRKTDRLMACSGWTGGPEVVKSIVQVVQLDNCLLSSALVVAPGH